MSLRDRLRLFLTGMLLFCLPPPSCFLNVCLPTLLAAVLKLFFPLTTSATAGTASYNKSAPTRSAAGMIFFFQERNGGSPKTFRRSSKTTPSLASNTFVVGKFKSV